MKRILILLVILLSLSGCADDRSSIEPALRLRQQIAEGNSYSFDTVITADYTDKIYTFQVHCMCDKQGELSFTVTKPDTIAGIQGSISANGGQLQFDDNMLSFSMLADGQITPVAAPWIFIKALQSGYIRGCEEEKDSTHIIIDDTYEECKIQVDVYLSENQIPIQGDILWEGRRIITVEVENFQIL